MQGTVGPLGLYANSDRDLSSSQPRFRKIKPLTSVRTNCGNTETKDHTSAAIERVCGETGGMAEGPRGTNTAPVVEMAHIPRLLMPSPTDSGIVSPVGAQIPAAPTRRKRLPSVPTKKGSKPAAGVAAVPGRTLPMPPPRRASEPKSAKPRPSRAVPATPPRRNTSHAETSSRPLPKPLSNTPSGRRASKTMPKPRGSDGGKAGRYATVVTLLVNPPVPAQVINIVSFS